MADKAKPLTAALLLLAVSINPAHASSPELPAGYSCDDIRAFVALHGYWTAIAWAVAHGATRSQLKAAKHCLEKA